MVISGQYRMFSRSLAAYYAVNGVADTISVIRRQKCAYAENHKGYVDPPRNLVSDLWPSHNASGRLNRLLCTPSVF